jgi:CpXC protein
MKIRGTAHVRCPACGTEQDCQLAQSINARDDRDDKQRLLAGELNVLVCSCGKRTQLSANVLFHDPDADYFCHVVPGGDDAMAKAADAFRASGARGTQRLVPSINALVEKVKVLDAGLEDWVIEMAKVLLLASLGDGELYRVLLFDTVDRETGVISWVLFDANGREPRAVASPLSAYDKLAARTHGKPSSSELQIDRAWAVEAVRVMIAGAN